MDRRDSDSRMFDVRPGKERGGFWLSAKDKDRPNLNQLTTKEAFSPEEEIVWREMVLNSDTTINLRGKQPLSFAPAVKKNRGRPKKTKESFFKKRNLKEVPILNFFRAAPAIIDELEISQPSREEIMAVLEAVEQVDQYVQGFSFSQAKNASIDELDRAVSETESNPIEPKQSEFDGFAKVGFLASDDLLGQDEPGIAILESETEFAPKKQDDYFEEFVLEPSEEESAGVLDDLEIEPFGEREKWSPSAQSRRRENLAGFFSRFHLAKKHQAISLIPADLKKDYFIASGRRQKDEFSKKHHFWRGAGFVSAGFIIWLVIFGMSLAGRGLLAKSNILSSALSAYKAMLAAKDSVSRFDFSGAQVNFEEAYGNFWQAQQELNKMGGLLVYILEKLPGGSAVSSGSALVSAGENLAKAGNSFAKIANILVSKNLEDSIIVGGVSLTEKIVELRQELVAAQKSLVGASEYLSQVNAADLPVDMRESIESLKQKIPVVAQAATQLKNWSGVFLDVLGQERAKKYLLVFQNNSEARATGGFIGSYGVLDLDKGQIKNLFIDGIFNLDGQLYEKIIPPKPIQKISTAWSTHDANWFVDFPTSARKIMNFYEKAGGATVDGVISLTPTVIERLLVVTGSVDMPEYGVVLTSENFMDTVQYEVEVDYDRAQNQPKKILADFAPKFLEKLTAALPQSSSQILDIMLGALQEKHILFYFSDAALEKVFAEQGWAGQVLETDKDYLNVVNTNINGYKTDKVVEQKIFHQSQVRPDGSIIDSVRVVRAHRGGQSQYDWYNKVNADYLRVYVPSGSKLISAQGQTLEAASAPIDYVAAGFKADVDIATQEQGTIIDQNSGTQIFSESGKTVFGNWVYVSPGETVEITYQYLLPFKLDLAADNFSWSLLAQKQSGSIDSQFESTLELPQEFKVNWQYPADLQISGSQIKFSGDLKTDRFFGVVFAR